MNPKEKADKIYEAIYDKIEDGTAGMFEEDVPYIKVRKSITKDCANLLIDEILEAIYWHEFEVPNVQIAYWNKVKEEIELI